MKSPRGWFHLAPFGAVSSISRSDLNRDVELKLGALLGEKERIGLVRPRVDASCRRILSCDHVLRVGVVTVTVTHIGIEVSTAVVRSR